YRCDRRRNVVEETSPFVIVHDKDSVRPVGTRRYRIVNLVYKVFARANIGVGMIVLRGSARFILEPRIDEGHFGQLAGRGVGEKLCDRETNVEIGLAPQ